MARLLAPACEVVGEVTDGSALLAEVLRLRPDVVVVDLMMPGVNGLDACRQVRAAAPETRVIIYTATDDSAIKSLAFEAGASGFVLKGRAVEDLPEAIRNAMRGEAPE